MRVPTFFYGSYMNPSVLAEVGLAPERFVAASLSGYEVTIGPWANLVRAEGGVVYGLVAWFSHDDLERLYAHARDVLRQAYLPEPVLVATRDGTWLPVLCYIAPAMEPRPASDAYIDRIVGPAREHGFPSWYVRRLETFRSPAVPGAGSDRR